MQVALSPNRKWVSYTGDEYGVREVVIASFPDGLRDAQPLFDRTGGLHAAGLSGAGFRPHYR